MRMGLGANDVISRNLKWDQIAYYDYWRTEGYSNSLGAYTCI